MAWVTVGFTEANETAHMPDIVVPPSWRERLEEVAGRRREVWLVAALILVVVLGAIAVRSRAAEPSIAPPATAPPVDATVSAFPGSTNVSPPPSVGPAPGTILVHVAGAVRRPGLYEMPAGSRIADAIDVARGPQPAADLNALNLAEPLADGQKVEVPKRGQAVSVPTTPGAIPGVTPGSPVGATVNLNSADQIALETIPGIGPVTATAIIAYRTEVGQFESIEQLLEVTGIGPATLESMRPYITI